MSATPFNALKSPTKPIAVPSWMIWLQCFAFAILYGIWAVPETILIRHVCLILGGLIGIYEIYIYRDSLLKRAALPIYLIAFLFIWTMIQFFFITPNPALQWEELTSIWKRTAIGFIFAVGLGLFLSSRSIRERQAALFDIYYWRLIYIGLLLPTLIYLLKYVLTFHANQWGFTAPDYLRLHYGSMPFYMPKTVYVAFCLPLFAIALGQIATQIERQQWRPWSTLVYLLSCLAVLFVFYAENIKNGIAYALVLAIFFFANLLYKNIKLIKLKESMVLLAFITVFGFFIAQHVQKNESWSTLYADMKVAIQIDQYDHWKWNSERGYPNNELGKMVSITNYDRIAWGVAGVQLLIENPLGYGLVERSFGHLAKIKWPESKLHQNHSGWLDLALGLGLPGIGLILGALTLALKQCRAVPGPIGNFGFWLLLSLALLWCTTEVSQKVFFDWLVFAIAWIAALALGDAARDASTKSHTPSLS
jgi:hypothetical protein